MEGDGSNANLLVRGNPESFLKCVVCAIVCVCLSEKEKEREGVKRGKRERL